MQTATVAPTVFGQNLQKYMEYHGYGYSQMRKLTGKSHEAFRYLVESCQHPRETTINSIAKSLFITAEALTSEQFNPADHRKRHWVDGRHANGGNDTRPLDKRENAPTMSLLSGNNDRVVAVLSKLRDALDELIVAMQS